MLLIHKSTTEEELLRDCRKGKAKAQQTIYERLAPKMLGVCVRYIRDRDEAEHVMIGGMVRLFEKLDQFKGEGSFEGWVRRIMVTECLMYLRKNKSLPIEVAVEKADEEPDYRSLEDHLEAADLINLISELPTGYRTVFNLYAIEGYSHKEIADSMGINENTSKSQLSRARTYLQKRLLEMNQIKQKENGTS